MSLDIQISLETNRVAGGEPIEVIASITCDEAREVVLYGRFELDMFKLESRAWKKLHAGRMAAGTTDIELRLDAPNGPFHYEGRSINCVWSVTIEATSGAEKVHASERIVVEPGAMVVTARPGKFLAPPKERSAPVLDAFSLGVLGSGAGGVVLFGMGISTASVIIALLCAFAGAIPVVRAIWKVVRMATIHGGYEVTINPDNPRIGAIAVVRVRPLVGEMGDIKKMNVDLVLDEVSFRMTTERKEWVSHSVIRIPNAIRPEDGDEREEVEVPIQIPRHFPATWEESEAGFRWYVELTVERLGADAWTSKHPVLVLPPTPLDHSDSNPVAQHTSPRSQ